LPGGESSNLSKFTGVEGEISSLIQVQGEIGSNAPSEIYGTDGGRKSPRDGCSEISSTLAGVGEYVEAVPSRRKRKGNSGEGSTRVVIEYIGVIVTVVFAPNYKLGIFTWEIAVGEDKNRCILQNLESNIGEGFHSESSCGGVEIYRGIEGPFWVGVGASSRG